jgi:hypothetical protein
MTLFKLASELDETARQTAALAAAVGEALDILSNRELPAETARQDAARRIVMALQGEDRIAQRCHNLAAAVRRFASLPANAPASAYEAIWAALVMDELRFSDLAALSARPQSGEAELF